MIQDRMAESGHLRGSGQPRSFYRMSKANTKKELIRYIKGCQTLRNMTDLIFRLNVDDTGRADLSQALDGLVEGHTVKHEYYPGDDFTRMPGNILSKPWTLYGMETGAIALRYSVEEHTPAIPRSRYKEPKSYRPEEPKPALKRVTVQIRIYGAPEGTPTHEKFWGLVNKLREEYPSANLRFGAEVSKAD